MRFFRNHSEYFVIFLLLAGILFFSFHYFFNKEKQTYDKKLFDDSIVHEISIELTEKDYNTLLATPTDKIRFHADITIDGEKTEDVSLSTHGNATVFTMEATGETKFSYKINFGKYNNTQTYYGLDKMILGNLYKDSSAIKEYLTYYLMRENGVEAPLCSYVNLTINNEPVGLYLAIEEIDESFLARYKSPEGTALYKPSATGVNHSKRKSLKSELFDGEELGISQIPDDPDFDFEGADLVYQGDEIEKYPAIFENQVNKSSPESKERLIEAIKALSQRIELEKYWNFDSLANYFAVHNFLTNFDSYTGPTAHNYYLELKNDKVSMLPWDYDLSILRGTDPGLSIDSPLQGPGLENRPLWNALSKNYEFNKKYHESIQRMLDEQIYTNELFDRIDRVSEMILPYAKDDPNGLFSEDKVLEETSYIKEFLTERSDNVQKQLWGL